MQCTSYRSHVFQHLFWKLLRAWKNGGGVTADFRKPVILKRSRIRSWTINFSIPESRFRKTQIHTFKWNK